MVPARCIEGKIRLPNSHADFAGNHMIALRSRVMHLHFMNLEQEPWADLASAETTTSTQAPYATGND